MPAAARDADAPHAAGGGDSGVPGAAGDSGVGDDVPRGTATDGGGSMVGRDGEIRSGGVGGGGIDGVE